MIDDHHPFILYTNRVVALISSRLLPKMNVVVMIVVLDNGRCL